MAREEMKHVFVCWHLADCEPTLVGVVTSLDRGKSLCANGLVGDFASEPIVWEQGPTNDVLIGVHPDRRLSNRRSGSARVMIPLKDFMTAGNAIFTVELPPEIAAKHRPHYTFRVRKPEKEEGQRPLLFVSLLAGPENTSDYQYLGVVEPASGKFRTTRASSPMHGTYVAKLIERVAARAWAGDEEAIRNAGFGIHHEGRCCRCGRRLTVPESIESGIGPICATGGIDS